MRKSIRLTAALGAIAVASISSAALAAAEDAGDIVVTALKREQSLQDVPVSITAITGEALENQGISNLHDAVRLVPGVSFLSDFPVQTQIQMRGIGGIATADATVGSYIDEVPMNLPGRAFIAPIDIADLQRVEALLGPQGTLYGVGSMGGMIRVVTNDPQFDGVHASFRGELTDMTGGEMSYRGDAVVNVPLGEKIAFRGVASYQKLGGFVDAVFTSPNGSTVPVYRKNVDSLKRFSTIAKLLINPTDNLSMKLSYYRARDNSMSDNQVSVLDSVLKLTPIATPDQLTNYRAGHDIASLSLGLDLDGFRVENHSSYAKTRGPSGPVYQSFAGALIAIPKSSSGGRSYSNELRVLTTGDGPLSAVGGLIVQDARAHIGTEANFLFFNYIDTDNDGIPDTPSDLDNNGLMDIVTLPSPFSQNSIRSNSWAVFGELSYALMDNQLTLLAGGRYFEDKRRYLIDTVPNPGEDPDRRSKYSAFSPRFNISYKPNDETNIFFNVAKGFRSGVAQTAPAVAFSPPGTDTSDADSDTVWTYEVGTKLRLADRKLSLALSVFYSDWKNMQIGFTPVGSFFSLVANGGDARVKGIEAALVWKTPVPGLEFLASANYQSAKFKSVDPRVSTSSPAFVKGARIPTVPRYSGNLELNYSGKLNEGLSLEAGAAMQFADGQTSPDGNGLGVQPPTGKWEEFSARLGVRGDNWSATLFGRNLGNDKTSRTNSVPQIYAAPRPRTYGIRVGYDF